MATTAIWDVKDNLQRVLNYASNPNKTEVHENSYHYNGLEQAISYTTNDLKTEKQLYVTGLNCNLATAHKEMMITKKGFNKTDGILAYHAYQSFVPGEVDAETAHQIGIELAQEMWGDHFEVLVSTHLDKKHFHNHFIINSVSFIDGKKYKDNKENYKKMRKCSDDLCRKYRLSVIENPQNRKMHYAEWIAEQNHKPTWRSVIRDDVDYAISHSMTMKQFYSNLEKQGYEIKFGKHIAIRPKGKERFVRLRSLDKKNTYTEDNIKDMILAQSVIKWESISEPKKQTLYYKGNLSKARKITGFKALYFKYMYMMGILPKNAPNKKKVHFLLKEDLIYMDKITQEVTLISKKKIDNIADLDANEYFAKSRLDNLIKERRCIYNKVKRCRKPELKEQLQQDISSLSNEIKELRKEVVLYEGIRQRSLTMKNKMKMIEQERKENNEHEHGRNIRSNR